jgi:hypothetical protein
MRPDAEVKTAVGSGVDSGRHDGQDGPLKERALMKRLRAALVTVCVIATRSYQQKGEL